MIHPGYVCTPAEFLRWTSKPMHPALPSVHLTGARLMVMRDEPPESWKGTIVIPDTVRDKNPPGIGVVVGVGPLVGVLTPVYPGGLQLDHAQEALGMVVYFTMYSGIGLRLDLRDTEFKGKAGYDIIILADRDIQAWCPARSE